MADVAQRLLAAQGRVVWLTDGQEVRGQVPRHHLTRVDENVDGEEAEDVDSYKKKQDAVKTEDRTTETERDGLLAETITHSLQFISSEWRAQSLITGRLW